MIPSILACVYLNAIKSFVFRGIIKSSFVLFYFFLFSLFFALFFYDLRLGSSDGDSQIAVNCLPSGPAVRPNVGQGGTESRSLNQVPDDMSGSRQSFRIAMTNPCQMNEYFVDVM